MQSKIGWLFIATIMVSSLLLASCNATASEQSSTTSTPTGPYGTLKVVGYFGTGHLDPQTNSGETFKGIGSAIFDTLVDYDDNDKLVPGIAERWEIAPDGMSQTFYIRKGVKFHNGDDLTAADVKWSIERMMAPTTANQDAGVFRGAIASIDLKDDYTVVFRMKQPQYDMLKGIDNGMTATLPKKYIEEKGLDYFLKNMVGSGPWKVVKFEPGTRLELEAVESHWRKVPGFKNLVMVSVTDESSIVAQLKTGELDMALVSTDSVPGLKTAGIRIVSFDRGTAYYVWPFYDVDNPGSAPIGDVRVRKAVQLSINSKELADKLFSGNGGPQVMAFVRPTAYFWDANVLKQDPYDPEGAKKLLAEAGYASGFSPKLYDVGAGSVLSTLNIALDGYYKKVGINTQVVPIEFNSFRPKFNPKIVPEIYNSLFTYRTNGYRDAEGLTVAYHSQKASAKTAKNPKLDEMIDKIAQTLDPAEKKKAALEAARLAKEEYSTLSVVSVYPAVAISAKIGEVPRRVVASIYGSHYESVTHGK